MRCSWWFVSVSVCVGLLSACSNVAKDKSPTLKNLENATVKIDRDLPVENSMNKAKENYESLLGTIKDETLRKQAMRRLADLEMKAGEDLPAVDTQAQTKAEAVEAVPDYKKAMALYQSLLRSYPNSPDNDRILYQLAKAYEATGDIQKSLDTLTQLVKTYPNSRYMDEVQFRRGELFFSRRLYDDAEQAYAAALKFGKKTVFFERAIFKHGWALYKQEKYAEALKSFFALLDIKIANKRLAGAIADADFLNRGDKELLSDTFRVISLSLSSLSGVDTLAKQFTTGEPPNYEFLIYKNLAEFYLQQERYTDAAAAYSAFGKQRPEHPQELFMHVKAIEIYKQRGYPTLVLPAKKELVRRYQAFIEYWATNTHHGFREYLMRGSDAEAEQIDTIIAATTEELGRYYHAQAQKSKRATDYEEAAKWYRTFLRNFLQHPKAAEINFLAAEVLYEDHRFAEAIREYEKTAYNYSRHKRGAEAGYAALLAYEEYKKTLDGEDKDFWARLAIQSAQRFSKLYPKDPRAPAVLMKVVEEMFDTKQYKEALGFARHILDTAPANDLATRRKALLIIAHSDFEEGNFAQAEKDYVEALQVTPQGDPARNALSERLAASIYKQGEKSRDAGDLVGSTAHFLRVAKVVAASTIRVTAEYDAAANLIKLKDWAKAIQVLEAFQRDFPSHKLAKDIPDKLALAYLESGNGVKAAEQLERIAGTKGDPNLSRDALMQAAELYEKGNDPDKAIAAYKRFLDQSASGFDQSIEVRQKIASLYEKQKQTTSQHLWLKQILEAVQKTPNPSDRLKYLAANAAIVLAEPAYEAFHQVQLIEPLKANIAKKRQALDVALKSFNQAAEFRIAEVATAATYRVAQMYSEFSRALLDSERPKGMSAEALEQYELVLEEQAYPLEEKSIEFYEANVKRVNSGIYDEWIKKSFGALATMLPARYGKVERPDAVADGLQ